MYGVHNATWVGVPQRVREFHSTYWLCSLQCCDTVSWSTKNVSGLYKWALKIPNILLWWPNSIPCNTREVWVGSLHNKLSYRKETVRHATSVETLATAAQLFEKSHLRKLATGEWLWRSLWSSEIAWLNRPYIYITSCWQSLVTTSVWYLAPFPRYYLLTMYCVTFKNPPVSIKPLKLKASYA